MCTKLPGRQSKESVLSIKLQTSLTMGIWKGKMSIYFCEMEETENSNFCLMQDQDVRWHQLLCSNSTDSTGRSCWCPTPPPRLCSAILRQYLTLVHLTKPDPKPHPRAGILPTFACLTELSDAGGLGLPSLCTSPIPWGMWGGPTDHRNFLRRGTQVISLILRYTRNLTTHSFVRNIKQVPLTFNSTIGFLGTFSSTRKEVLLKVILSFFSPSTLKTLGAFIAYYSAEKQQKKTQTQQTNPQTNKNPQKSISLK